ncbi:NADPH oxidase organizer 1 [Elgaria multicarinata webbii]|uniref:NADPH oxidase organizer 1 n=1 Tax=Elgaria multicarinata webbii TaxID=159646 RepID=UPI002FCCC17E
MSSIRFPVEVKAVGLLKHGKQKICMLSVSWSDQNNILIYRAFEEFKKLHKELKRKFPIESGLLKKTERTIPSFRDANVMLRKKQTLSRCMESLKLLEIYCQELLRTQPQIVHGEDMIEFFGAQSRDLNPSFPENSIVVLPSEMGDRKEAAPTPSNPTITQPVVSQMYTCVEAFETNDTKNRPFKANRGEVLGVLMKDKTGWWLVENHRKQIAWFPAPYLEETEEAPIVRVPSKEGMLHFLTRAYEAKEPDELSVKVGVVVEVLERSDSGWWLVWYNGNAGYVPSMFLQPYQNPHSRFLALAHSSLSLSTPNLAEAHGVVSRSSPTQQKGDRGEAAQAHRRGGRGPPLGRIRSHSLGTAEDNASPNLATEDSLSDSSGTVSEQGFYWPQDPDGQKVGTKSPAETFHDSLRSEDSPSPSLDSKHRSDSGFHEAALGCTLPSSDPDGLVVPPRPSPHEILQRCTTITKRAMQGASP